MELPVFKLYLTKPSLEAMLLSPEKQQELMGYNAQAMADVGAKTLLTADIFSDENYVWLGVEEYPNLAAVIEHNRCLAKVNWLQYLTSEVYLGTNWFASEYPVDLEPYHPVEGAPLPIYKAWIGRFNKQAFTLEDRTEEEKEKLAAVRAYSKEVDIVQHLSLVSVQFNELWTAWGLERFPNHEALEKDALLKWDADWWRHLKARAYLGTATGGFLSGL
jgi:hypothetical protein